MIHLEGRTVKSHAATAEAYVAQQRALLAAELAKAAPSASYVATLEASIARFA